MVCHPDQLVSTRVSTSGQPPCSWGHSGHCKARADMQIPGAEGSSARSKKTPLSRSMLFDRLVDPSLSGAYARTSTLTVH